MTPAIFIDANVPIYAAGSPHPLKLPCLSILALIANNAAGFVTNAEVLQELLHRYLAVRQWPQGRDVFRNFAELMQEQVEPVLFQDAWLAADLADLYPRVDARDLVHAAVMLRLGIRQIVTADKGFDQIDGIERLDPANLTDWQVIVTGPANS